jgi:hypothetical protein
MPARAPRQRQAPSGPSLAEHDAAADSVLTRPGRLRTESLYADSSYADPIPRSRTR